MGWEEGGKKRCDCYWVRVIDVSLKACSKWHTCVAKAKLPNEQVMIIDGKWPMQYCVLIVMTRACFAIIFALVLLCLIIVAPLFF